MQPTAFTIEQIVTTIVAGLLLLAPWVGIWLQNKSYKNEAEGRKSMELKEKNDKAVIEAEAKGRHAQKDEQIDKEISAIWTEITQHGAKIQVVEVAVNGLGQKMDMMMDILKEIKEDVKETRLCKD